ncbi:MAG: hypothetical protein QOJ67_3433 [Acidimicrobiaceae bacterium]
MSARSLAAAAALVVVAACSGGGGRASTSTSSAPSTSTTAGAAAPTSVTADPSAAASDADNGGRAFARLYAAALRQQANGAVDDTQAQCIEDQLIATFGGAHILALSNTSYATMPPGDREQLVRVLQGCGLTADTLATLGVTPSS